MGEPVSFAYLQAAAFRVNTMLHRSTGFLRVSVVASELPAMRRMPAPTPLPTLARPGMLERLGQWMAARRGLPAARARHSAQVLPLRA
jgi:hypothetical protein